MTLKSGTSQACAACKYQRRKCNSECQLAPYFPPDNPKMFLNAHKLFGVSNISKILKNLDPAQKAEAMNSIIIQANLRARFPVHGCVEVIQHYMNQIRQCEHELQAVHSLLAMCHQQHHQMANPPLLDGSPSQLQLGMAPFQSSSSTPPPPPPPAAAPFSQPYCPTENYSYSNSCNNAAYTSNSYVESVGGNENVVENHVWVQQPYENNDGNSCNNHDGNGHGDTKCLIPVESQTPAMREELLLQEFDEMKPYFDSTVFDKQSYVATKKAYDSSPESSMTDTMQSVEHVGDKELRSAAACFKLTSVN